MTYKGTVDKQEDQGNDVLVNLANVRSETAAGWREYGPGISFKVNYALARRAYYIGRQVEVTIRPVL